MQDVKIGDRVRAKRKIEGKYVGVPELGTLINRKYEQIDDLNYLVEFDEKFDRGHNGRRYDIKGKDKHCWQVESVERIENVFKTNDKKYILI